MQTKTHNILALDVGGQRVGLARANSIARLPQALTTLMHDDSFYRQLQAIIKQEEISVIVVGLPRGLAGQETEQTKFSYAFAKELKREVKLPVYLQDEALTSRAAEKELHQTGKPYAKGDIDALAAVYILEDFLRSHHNGDL